MTGLVDVSEALRTVRVERLLRETSTRLKPPQVCLFNAWPPNYDQALVWRRSQLAQFELKPHLIESAKIYYRAHPVEFILHWCDLYEPRNAGTNKPTKLPFIMFPRQVELVNFFMSCLKDEQAGLVEKSRDMGATWIFVALSVWLWAFWPGAAIHQDA